jgi:membrane protease YdiL (CAAX protease family)
VIGALLVLLSLILLGGGGTALWADRTQRDAGYVTRDVHKFSISGAALATESTHLGSPGVGWLYSPGLLGKVRIRVTPVDPGSVLFVGIGPSSDVDRYLAGVKRTVISEFFEGKVQAVDGGPPQSLPGTEDFWVASASGAGAQTLKWDLANGSWTVVVMNANGRPGIEVGADLGARMPAVLWIAIGLLAAGAVFLAGGALLIAGAFRRNRTLTTNREGGAVSTPAITVPIPHALAAREEEIDRYAGIKQYSLAQIVAVWAAAAVPMGILAWIVAPAIKDSFAGDGNVPMIKALLLLLTAGLIWQFVLVAILVWREQRTFRWSTIRDALWLLSPRSPRSGRVGGRVWLIVVPLIALFALEAMLPAVGAPENRDLGKFLGSDVGHNFMSGAWGWFGVLVVLWVFNTVLGEELLFRGVLLPRMKRTFGRGDWVANGVLFAVYHVHMPWLIPANLLDMFVVSYPTRRYQSAWIGIAVHTAQSVFFAVIVLTLVL